MGNTRKPTDFFDDDFEVIYEDDITYTEEDSYEPSTYRDYSDFDTFDTEDEEEFSNPRTYTSYEDEDENKPPVRKKKPSKSRKKRKRRRPLTHLAAPIQKGGDAVFGLARSVTRNLSLLLMIGTTIFMCYNFWRGSAPYGDIEHAIATNTYTPKIAAYFSVVTILLFYQIISMLWTMTKARVRDEYGRHKEDVGRGRNSFIALFLLSYAAFIFHRWIPETHEVLHGLKGALDVFGSMHNVLFGLCLAGVISCLFRKYSAS